MRNFIKFIGALFFILGTILVLAGSILEMGEGRFPAILGGAVLMHFGMQFFKNK